MVTGKEACKSTVSVFFIFTKYLKKQKICYKLISHISSDYRCAVYICATVQHHQFSTLAKREREQQEDIVLDHILIVDGLWTDSSKPELKWQNA
jgi:hypothetical protein